MRMSGSGAEDSGHSASNISRSIPNFFKKNWASEAASEAQFFLKKLGIDREMLLALWPESSAPLPDIRIYTKEDWKAGTEDRLRFQVQVPVLRDEPAAASSRNQRVRHRK